MLNRLFPGRVTVGVGHGVQSWMRQVGAAAESPMTLLREHLTALRALLRGERMTVDGRYVRLDEAEAASNVRALVEAGAAAVVLQPAEGADIDPVDLVRFTGGLRVG
jgi:alkanesulfonate monooxygenase SsuD/methylene tetrahydromethanopterin reductase-like flavin-dependent oxidoreductase (luciferase family)